MRRIPSIVVAAFTVAATLFLSDASAQTTILRPGDGTTNPGVMTMSAPPGASSTPQAGTAVVRGRVVDVGNGTGLKNVAVRLSGGGLRESRTAGTDERGFFQIDELPAGRFNLSASKPGYVTLSYGQRRPFEAGTTLDVADKQTIENVNFALPRGGVIAVRVTDEFGDPISGIRVAAQRNSFFQGRRGLSSVGSMSTNPFSGGTDDLGEARIYGLPPGEYYVTATSAGPTMGPLSTLGTASKGLSYVQTFYPGTPSISEAQRVSVAIGREVAVSFPLSRSRLARIGGTVRSSDGSVPPRSTGVSLFYSVAGGVGSRGMYPQPDGSFSLSEVPPGDYEIHVLPPGAGAVREYATVPITVTGADMTNLSIVTTKPGSLRGRFVFDTPPPTSLRPASLQPLLSSFDGGGITAGQPRVNDDWTFEVTGVMDNRVVRLRTPSNGWYLKAVMFEGRDIIDTPIDFGSGRDVAGVEVVVTQKQTKLTGTVTDADGKPLTTYAVVVFSAASERWTAQSRFIASARADQQGRYEVAGLPPGAYLAIALDYLETGSERDPDLLKRLKDFATPLSLEEGEAKTLSLKIVNQ